MKRSGTRAAPAVTLRARPVSPPQEHPCPSPHKSRLAFAGILAAAALGAAAPAQADKAERCERQLERIEDRFRQIEERRGWEAASSGGTTTRWPKYYERCEAP